MQDRIYVVDPDRSGPPLRFDGPSADANQYLDAHPRAAIVPVHQVAPEHR